jgi:hypothetical protein
MMAQYAMVLPATAALEQDLHQFPVPVHTIPDCGAFPSVPQSPAQWNFEEYG